MPGEERERGSVLPGMGVPDDITDEIMGAVGRVWARGALSPRERSLVTISALAASGSREALRVHLGGGLRHGLAESDLYEALLQVGYYAGFGAAMDAFPLVQAVAAEHERDDRSGDAPS